MREHFLLYKGDMETTSFFLGQMQEAFLALGRQVYAFTFVKDNTEEKQNITQLLSFFMQWHGKCLEEKDTNINNSEKLPMISFNFAGIFGEDKLTTANICWDQDDKLEIFLHENYPEIYIENENKLLVDVLDLYYINIVVDHPYHYHLHLSKRPKNYAQICIDKNHVKYMKRFFDEIDTLGFLPSGGTKLSWEEDENQSEKRYDVVFTGTYMRPDCFDVFIERNGQEYADFYRKMLREVIEGNHVLLEEVVEKSLYEEIPEMTFLELKETLGHIMFLDYYIRFYRREWVIRTLVDAGIRVHCFGGGWETFSCEKPENLIYETESGEEISLAKALEVSERMRQEKQYKSKYLTSIECLERIHAAKISLNILPGFEDGGHDRIYNTMLNEAVCVSDENQFLMKQLKDQKEIVFYKLFDEKSLIQGVQKVLLDEEYREKLKKDAYEMANNGHTWKKRVENLIDMLQ